MLLLTPAGRPTVCIARDIAQSWPFPQEFWWLQIWLLGPWGIGNSGLKSNADGSCSFDRQSNVVGDILFGSNSLKRQKYQKSK